MHERAQPQPERESPERAPARHPLLEATLALGALAVLVAAVSCWGVGWLQDDWRLLARARAHSWVLPEPNHLSLPQGLLWWLGDRTGSPLPARLAALAAHLLSYLVLLPAVARALRPGLSVAVARQVGLLGLCAWVALDPLIWACTAAYALTLPWLLLAIWLHLRGARPTDRQRLASLGCLAAALLTWELAVVGPPLLALASLARGDRPRAALRGALPAAALLLPYLGLKLLLGSTETLAPRGPLRLAMNLGATPLLLASPLPWPRGPLLGPLGLAAAALAWVGVLALGRQRQRGWSLALGLAPLLPVLTGPGPEARYLYLCVPGAALAVRLGLADLTAARARRLGALALGAWVALSAGSAWASAARWRAADRLARAVLEEAGAAGGPLALIDAPDRLPGWGPCWKHPVWRLGLREALAARGVTLVGRAHVAPADPEMQGLWPATPALTPALGREWARAGVQVRRVQPDGRLVPWPVEGRAPPAR